MTPSEVIQSISHDKVDRYQQYWNGITPKTNADKFRRWLFAFCSVHTTWESNVRGYEALKDLVWLGDRERLRTLLCWAGCGMHNNRTRFITEFAEKYWSRPDWYLPGDCEPWWAARDRIAADTAGLGLAKTSFALEMICPAAEVVCLDVHMLRLYTPKPAKIKPIDYHNYEDDWLGRCIGKGTPSYPTRMVWWDAQQGKEDSRYWSHVFE